MAAPLTGDSPLKIPVGAFTIISKRSLMTRRCWPASVPPEQPDGQVSRSSRRFAQTLDWQ
jgi:hypothetical protein